MTRARAGLLVVAALLAARAPAAAAQDSVFGIRGLGFLGLPLSGRSQGMGGGEDAFDGASALNPVSIAFWRGLSAWAVAAQSDHTFNTGSGDVSLGAMRFPTFGFATPLGGRWVVGLNVSTYLDRNYEVTQTDTVMPRDTALQVTDLTRSTGGVADARLAAAYRLSSRLDVGVGLHLLTGSVQTAVRDTFPSDSSYTTFAQTTETLYRGFGISVGVLATPMDRVVLAASARFNGRLSATNPGGSASVRLPTELAAGVYVAPFDGVALATTVTHANWSVAAPALVAAGQPPSQDVWSVGVGAEVTVVKLFGELTPLRVGYRWRQLPFPVPQPDPSAPSQTINAPLSERAFSGGLAFVLASGRANLDVAVEGGSRTAGTLTERFTTVVIGLSIFP